MVEYKDAVMRVGCYLVEQQKLGEKVDIFHESEMLDVIFDVDKKIAIEDIRFHMTNFRNQK